MRRPSISLTGASEILAPGAKLATRHQRLFRLDELIPYQCQLWRARIMRDLWSGRCYLVSRARSFNPWEVRLSFAWSPKVKPTFTYETCLRWSGTRPPRNV